MSDEVTPKPPAEPTSALRTKLAVMAKTMRALGEASLVFADALEDPQSTLDQLTIAAKNAGYRADFTLEDQLAMQPEHLPADDQMPIDVTEMTLALLLKLTMSEGEEPRWPIIASIAKLQPEAVDYTKVDWKNLTDSELDEMGRYFTAFLRWQQGVTTDPIPALPNFIPAEAIP